MVDAFYFNKESIEANAPVLAGVYVIFSGTLNSKREIVPESYIYIGEAKNIQERLLQHHDGESDQSECIWNNESTHFMYTEIADDNDRLEFEKGLIDQFGTVCN